MKLEEHIQLLDTLHKVYTHAKKSKLSETFLIRNEKDIKLIANYFKVREVESVFIAIALETERENIGFDSSDIWSYLRLSTLESIKFQKCLESLIMNKYFIRASSYARARSPRNNIDLIVNTKLKKALIEGEPIPKLKKEGKLTLFDLADEIVQLHMHRIHDFLSRSIMLENISKLVKSNEHLNFLQKIKNENLSRDDQYVLLIVAMYAIRGTQSVFIDDAVSALYDTTQQKVIYVQEIIQETNELINKQLIEYEEAHFYTEAEISLGNKSKRWLKEEGLILFNTKIQNQNIIKPTEIKAKKLVYNPSDQPSIQMLRSTLSLEQYDTITRRLSDRNLATGMASLLYGAPGTGKTELVYQIARDTRRAVYKVDISQSRSMWYGQSEKLFKKIFSDYEDLMEVEKNTPILLFNEADALFHRRIKNEQFPASRTNNTLQNILLEEMENFKGILIATTNLADNLDPAFSRRFLFKINFTKPEEAMRKEIWKNTLPHLGKQDLATLAKKYMLTGGQIDNIVRKCEIDQILHGGNSDIHKIEQYCMEEGGRLEDRPSIGFL